MSTGRLATLAAELAVRPRRWLVTGAAGFIGSHLVERLLALDQHVVGLDDFATGRRANLAAVARSVGAERWRRFALQEGDVRDPAVCERAATGCALVLHQAGLGSVPRSLAEPARTFAVNVAGTWNVLAAARAAGAERVVLASSSSVYGDSAELPQREEHLGRPLSPYAASKRAAELVAEGGARSGGPPSVALRYFNVFGPRQDPDGPYAAVVPRWAAARLAGRAPRLEGDGRQARDFTPVAAVVAANLLAATATLEEPYAAFNVGTGRATTLLELLEQLGRAAQALGLAAAPLAPERAPARPGDRRASQADLARSRAALGYAPPVALAEGLQATLRDLAAASARGS
ncbi:MAG TPA: NAD-dependent epimerase/dehydratase family protein [Planctomycetota bacterium]